MVARIAEMDAGAIGDASDFRSDVVERCEPLIVRQLCRDWPAVAAGRQGWDKLAAYLRSLDSGRAGRAFVGHREIAGRYYYGEQADGFNFGREMLSISQVLDRMDAKARDPADPSIYLGSVPAAEHAPAFAAENSMALLDPAVEPRLWLGGASHVAGHCDAVDNLACLVAGRRRFTLYPPGAIGDLYVGPIDHTLAGAPIALAMASAEGDPRYPRFEPLRDHALIAELEPGDALYLPKLWWHQVDATASANVLVNYWWDAFSAGPDEPMTAMMLAMITLAERPLAERRAWAAWFDHYAFREERHPLDHVPKDQRGILGPLKSGNYGRIRASVMQKLRGG